jgi:hypothetical protein
MQAARVVADPGIKRTPLKLLQPLLAVDILHNNLAQLTRLAPIQPLHLMHRGEVNRRAT